MGFMLEPDRKVGPTASRLLDIHPERPESSQTGPLQAAQKQKSLGGMKNPG
jgi:hypothetical protein